MTTESPQKQPQKNRVNGCLLIFLVCGCGISVLGYYVFSPNSPRNRDAVTDTILTWGRLAPFPSTAQDLTFERTGNMFTRGYRATFTAPAADIEQWLRQSPGIERFRPPTSPSGIRYFEIEPGGGAMWAEVKVDDAQHRVDIYVCWS